MRVEETIVSKSLAVCEPYGHSLCWLLPLQLVTWSVLLLCSEGAEFLYQSVPDSRGTEMPLSYSSISTDCTFDFGEGEQMTTIGFSVEECNMIHCFFLRSTSMEGESHGDLFLQLKLWRPVPDPQICLGLQSSDFLPLVLRLYNYLKEGHARCSSLQWEES